MALSDARIEIAGSYNYVPGEQNYITLAEARQLKLALRDKLSSFDELDYGYISFVRGGVLLEEIQPLSLCDFVWWAIGNAGEFITKGVIWLKLCENDALFFCRTSEVTVQVLNAVIPTDEWMPYFCRQLAHACSCRMNSDFTEHDTILHERSNIRTEFTIGLSD